MKGFSLLLFLCSGLGSAVANPSSPPAPRVEGPRIVQHLEALSVFGRNPAGGVSRVAYSDADKDGREYVLGLMKAAGLAVRMDTAGNLIGTRPGSDPALKPILIGSHTDSVPEGGNYDGDVGSLSAIEVAQVLDEHHVILRHPLEVIIFENEEGVMLGSSAVSSGVDEARLDGLSQSGKRVRDGVRFIGGDPDRVAESKMAPGSIEAYVELHIEQGAMLEQARLQIGVVEGIVGILDCDVTVEGFANHAGTTPMDQRRDALLAASMLIQKVNEIVRSSPGRQVGTVGWIRAQPGAFNVVPGKVVLGLELRDLDAGKIQDLYAQIRAAAESIGRSSGTTFQFEPHALSAPALTHPRLQALVEEVAKGLGLSIKRMPSGAGHDAQEMAAVGPVGMIFIPSVGGISHSPKEYSTPGDIENGANVLLGVLRKLDRP
jgi:N-carbamoyl-L-amino-acid hydrolase